jgi:transcriptional regulator with XRE-family HTH domain
MYLREFILAELKNKNISLREFARRVGVSSTAIVKATSDDPPEPTMDMMVKISRVTEVSVTALVAMCVPDDVVADADALALAEQIKNLPPEKREMVEALVRGYLSKS